MPEITKLQLVSKETQAELFGAEVIPVHRPDADKLRFRLQQILAEARAAETLPWVPARLCLYRTMFPQMTKFLPDDEGAQLRFEFATELERLRAA